ncbi:RNA pseudouridine synthase 7 [Oryza brachyantha]|uniref:RNA pseudouridine synthase 7 n=1 Tax=Oryza brachyantha TaxID=4533 RepID=UPI001AD97162|nr:RNA pseudouridine synthase 7 [Oryza brachyantha]XP_006647268.2 RNA pseudouridine synthase 7 [Oryza brachyantha]XP_015688834.2 RNA pseudouridine synthase 7 [Oryza brachyantha]XP_015688835.2 RNA pseudouridine synthase 7 [Oryza brachyantha]
MAAGPAGAGIVWQTPSNPPERQDYIFRNGRRYVRPYYFEFISHVKNRWAGKTIVDLFTDEFKGRPREYYVRAVNCGRLQVDDQMVHTDYIVQSSQKISHFLHRHEPPVLGGDITILQNEVDVVTVCKPASVPVHPCGQYRKNTVVGILQAEHGLASLFPVHRLDRLVSGLLIFAKNADKAESFRQQIETSLLQKEYVAKVVGVFPDGEQIVDANVHFNAREGRSTAEVCDGNGKAPIGKQACTKFQRICTDGTHSIVLCKPVTGRTHQIRVHLKHIGYPIANDEVYLSENFSPRSSKGTRINRATTLACSLPSSEPDSCADVGNKDTEVGEEFSIDPMCTNCPNLAPLGYDADEEGLWLHCVRYTGPDWSYECPYPDWVFLDNVSGKKLKS